MPSGLFLDFPSSPAKIIGMKQWHPVFAELLRPAEPAATEREVAKLVLEEPGLQERFGGWVASLHPAAWKEVEAMARIAGKVPKIDLRPAIEMLGLDRVIDQVGVDRVIDQIGIGRVIEHCGEKQVIKEIGLERWLASLSPAERRELKRRLH